MGHNQYPLATWGREIKWEPLALEREEFVRAPWSGPTAPPILSGHMDLFLPPPGPLPPPEFRGSYQ